MMNTLPDGPFSAFVGIDWADRKHDVCVQRAGEEAREFDRIAHQRRLSSGRRPCLSALVDRLRLLWSCRRGRLFMRFRSTISSCCFPSIQ